MKRLVGICVLVLVVAAPSMGFPQWVVNDPTNLVQNTMSAFSEAESVAKEIKQIKNQVEGLKLKKRDLKKLSLGDLKKLKRSFKKLEKLFEEGEQIGAKWGQVGEEFNETYEKYDPSEDGREEYQKLFKQWERQTKNAIKSAMRAHGVTSMYDWRRKDLSKLIEASNDADGTLAAIQAGNRISGILAKQMMELAQIIVSDSRARLSHMQEKRRKQQDSQKFREKNFMKDFPDQAGQPDGKSRWPEME